jgi:hypothetical protein
MAKGKYAARADSRLKVLESEALREAHVKITELEAQLVEARHEINTTRLQRRYEHPVRAREAAQRRLALAIDTNAKTSRLAELRRQLDMREYELFEIVKLMQPGTRSKVPWRPVAVTHAQQP